MRRKDFQAALPPVPDHFIERIDETLNLLDGQKRREAAHVHKYKRALLIAAVIMALSAATAGALIAHNHLLQEKLSNSGASEIALQVASPETDEAPASFSLSLDEYIWEDENLFLACTLTAPDDGQSYLAGLTIPFLNGEHLGYYEGGYYFDTESLMIVYPLGGEFPNRHTLLLPMIVDAERFDGAIPATLNMRAVFFSTNRAIRTGAPADDGALYMDEEKRIDLFDCAEIAALRPIDLDGWRTDRLFTSAIYPESISQTPWAKYLTSRELSVPLEEKVESAAEFNDVSQRVFQWDDLTITVEELRLTHFDLNLVLRIERPGGFPEEDPEAIIPYPNPNVGIPGHPSMDIALAYADASGARHALEYTQLGFYDRERMPDGSLRHYFEGKGVFPLDWIEELLICSEYLTPTGHDYTYDKRVDLSETIAAFKPIWSAEIAEQRATEALPATVCAAESER